ncbi:MAG: antitoxin MazE [Alteromonadaceae bacterium]|jgi:antitoxin MazE
MQTAVKLITIGDSKGICIPKALLLKYQLQEQVIIEEVDGGLLIYARDNQKLSWEDTYKATATAQEDWSDWQDFEDNPKL